MARVVGWVSEAQPTGDRPRQFGGLRDADPPYGDETTCVGIGFVRGNGRRRQTRPRFARKALASFLHGRWLRSGELSPSHLASFGDREGMPMIECARAEFTRSISHTRAADLSTLRIGGFHVASPSQGLQSWFLNARSNQETAKVPYSTHHRSSAATRSVPLERRARNQGKGGLERRSTIRHTG